MADSILNLTRPVAVLLTPAEVRALVSAAALLGAEYEGVDDDMGGAEGRRDSAYLDRVISKIHHAADAP